jgi:hypothetical protein
MVDSLSRDYCVSTLPKTTRTAIFRSCKDVITRFQGDVLGIVNASLVCWFHPHHHALHNVAMSSTVAESLDSQKAGGKHGRHDSGYRP